MEDEDIKCKECPSARHGFDRHASHNAGRYVCECESFVCPSEQLRQRVAELETQLAKNNPLLDEAADAIDKLTAERDEWEANSGQWEQEYYKVCKERDALVEANRVACEDIVDRHDRIAELKQQRDELLAAAEAIEINAEECLDFDECTAMLVPIDDYHKLMEAIASVKEK